MHSNRRKDSYLFSNNVRLSAIILDCGERRAALAAVCAACGGRFAARVAWRTKNIGAFLKNSKNAPRNRQSGLEWNKLTVERRFLCLAVLPGSPWRGGLGQCPPSGRAVLPAVSAAAGFLPEASRGVAMLPVRAVCRRGPGIACSHTEGS